VQLAPPGPATSNVRSELEDLLSRAIPTAVEQDEMLIVQLGGWGTPDTPYCLQTLHKDGEELIVVLETSPVPLGATGWPPADPDEGGVQITTVLNEASVATLAPMMLDAIGTWGIEPWDLALTFVAV
jgi:hypothetical protein